MATEPFPTWAMQSELDDQSYTPGLLPLPSEQNGSFFLIHSLTVAVLLVLSCSLQLKTIMERKGCTTVEGENYL